MNFLELQNEFSIPVDSRLAMLHLSSAAEATTGEFSGDQPPNQQCHSCGSVKRQPHFSPEISSVTAVAATITADTPDPSPEKTTLYSGATTKAKRYSNCRFSSSLEEPFPKRTATVLPPISTAATGDTNDNSNHHKLLPPIPTASAGDTNGNNNHHVLLPPISTNTTSGNNYNNFHGFIKIPLQNNQESPVTPSPAKPPLAPQLPRPLYRTLSDPTGSASYARKSPTPPHRNLARTASWLSNEGNSNNGESPTTMVKSPIHSSLARTASCWSPNVQDLGGSINNGESPTAMRLKRMKDGMREMRQWCDLMIQEETSNEENKIVKDDETETGGEALCEEAVWVERMGSCLILHFKCPCGKGYQILLCGNNCYYKLTNF